MGTYIYRLLAKYTTETYSGEFSITSNILQKPTKNWNARTKLGYIKTNLYMSLIYPQVI